MKNIEVITCEERYRQRWDKFVDYANNGTIFHKLKFLDYHPLNRLKFHHLIFREYGNILALLPGGLADRIFKSPQGASFGSFVMGELSFDKIDRIVQSFLKYCEEKGIEEVYLTPPPIIYSKVTSMNLDYALLYNGFKYSQHLYTSVIDLTPITDPFEICQERSRNAVRKAIKSGVRIEISEDYDSFYPILVENKRKFNVSPTHTLEELKKIPNLVPKNLKLFLAYRKKKLLAGCLIFICNVKTFIAFYIAQDYRYQRYRSVNYLLYEIIKWGKSQGFSYFDLGVNQDTASDNPMELNRTLISFKSSMGAKCFLRSTFYKKI